MKKIISVILVLFITAALLPAVSAAAEEEYTVNRKKAYITCDSIITGKAGDTVAIGLGLKNNPGVMYLAVNLDYDSDVFAIDAPKTESEGMTQAETGFPDICVADSGKRITFSDDFNAKSDGELATLYFKISDSAKSGVYRIGLTVQEAIDFDEKDVEFDTQYGYLKVENVACGDVNGDGVINGRDIIRLRKYLSNNGSGEISAEYEVTEGAECTGDGEINGKDLVRLRKYLYFFDNASGTSTISLGSECTEHTWCDWNILADSSCTEDGEKQRICAVCGASETEVIPAAHDYTVTTYIPATCSEQGYTVVECRVCGKVYTRSVIEATGHHYYNRYCLLCGAEEPYGEIDRNTAWYYNNTSASEYYLSTKEEMAGLSYLVNINGIDFSGKTIYLNNDIDFGNLEWEPIGDADHYFSGTFNGRNFAVKNLKVSEKSSYAGLFGKVNGTIRDLIISGANVYTDKRGENIAIACGHLEGYILNVTTSGYVTAEKCEKVGGVIGNYERYGSFTMEDLSNYAEIKGGNFTGGIAGRVYNYCDKSGTYTETHNRLKNNGPVSGSDYVGGIAGYVYANNVYWRAYYINASNLENTGSVHGKNYVGGLYGYAYSNTSDSFITQSSSGAEVSGVSYVGGLVGWLDNMVMTNCSNAGTTVEATGYYSNGSAYYAYLGGYVGYSYTISGCINRTDINYTGRGMCVGGIAGYSVGAVSDCENSGNIKGSDYTGGIVGYVETYGSLDFIDLVNSGDIRGGDYTGGIAGRIYSYCDKSGTYTHVYIGLENTGDIVGRDYTGGLIGYLLTNNVYWRAYYINIKESNNTGTVLGRNYVGGLLGYVYSNTSDSYITLSSSNAGVSGVSYVGGLAGCLDNVRMTDCSNEGSTVEATGYYSNGSTYYAYLGGYAGYANSVSGCVNRADIIYTSRGMCVGGIAGFSNGVIYDCENYGDIKGNDYTGGIAGYVETYGNLNFTDLYNSGDVTGNNYTGGIIGRIYSNCDNSSTYTAVYLRLVNTGNITGNDYTAGIIGHLHANNSYWRAYYVNMKELDNTGRIYGDNYVGGLVGYGYSNTGDSYISISSSGAEIKGISYVGGLAGSLQSIQIMDCSNAGSTIEATGYFASGSAYYAYLGGYAGCSYAITGCVNEVNINYAERGMYVGGITGYSNGAITECENRGNIKGADYTGGIVGFDELYGNYTFSDLTNTGRITGGDYTGGIAGRIYSNCDSSGTYTAVFLRLTNSGAVTGGDYTGGLIGHVHANNSYWRAYYINMKELDNSGNVSGKDFVGGLLGYVYSNTSEGSFIEYYTQTGSVFYTGSNGGALIGSNNNIELR